MGHAYSIQLNDNKHLHSFKNKFILNHICAHAYPQYSILAHVGTLRGQRCHVTLKLELQAIVKHPRQVLGTEPRLSATVVLTAERHFSCPVLCYFQQYPHPEIFHLIKLKVLKSNSSFFCPFPVLSQLLWLFYVGNLLNRASMSFCDCLTLISTMFLINPCYCLGQHSLAFQRLNNTVHCVSIHPLIDTWVTLLLFFENWE